MANRLCLLLCCPLDVMTINDPALSSQHPRSTGLGDPEPRRKQALRALWSFYEPRCPEIMKVVYTSVLRHGEWRAVYGEVSTFAETQREVLGLLRQAILGDRWEPYLEYLRGRGRAFATQGISHASWLELVGVYRDALRGEAERFVDTSPEANRLVARQIHRGISFLLDAIRRTLAEAYISTKEELLARSEAQYRSMFDYSPLPMWMYHRESLRIVAVNEAAVRHYGYSREEFLELTIADLRRPEDLPELTADVRAAKGLASPRTWRHRKKDGSEITVEVTAHDFEIEDQAVRLVLAQDVTEREQAKVSLVKTESQLRHAQKMEAVGRLAGGVAHDMNNILTAVSGYAALLEEDLEPDDPRRDDAAEIRRATERAEAITRQLLTLSRHGIAKPRPLDLGRLVDGFLPMLRRLVGEEVVVRTQLRKTAAVIADPGQIEQVLMNLAVNARDAMPDGGRLIVETQEIVFEEEAAGMRGLGPGRYTVLIVTDTGTGMDAETRDRIFDPFFTTKEEGKGTGLGLSIVHGIVAQAGGSVRVYSEPGHGSTFRVHLPAVQETVGADREQAPAAVPPRQLGALTVLLVDDDRDIRTVARRVLTSAGCKVLEAATAEEARRICVEHDNGIDVVVLDVVLPDGRGDRLIDELRELRPQVAMVLMSGYPAGALTRNGGVPGDLLAKPFTPGELRLAVAQAVGLGEPVGERPTVRSSTDAGREKPRVLLVDDDSQLRRMLARVLRRAGLEVVEAESGRQAIAALGAGSFDVVLSDVHMPDGDGIELIREVRRVDLDVPVILMTGQPDLDTAAQAIEYGAFRYLSKPIDTDQLRKTAQHAARAHSLARLRREALLISGVDAGAVDRAGLEVRFEAALGELWMAYQPIVEARSGVLFAAEALMRSREPSLANPLALLDAAKQLGRLPQLGRKVRELSAANLAAAPSEHLHLFVNLHPSDLLDEELVRETAPLSAFAHRVVLEVTERAALEESEAMRQRLARLRELGFRLAVDDIGAGYSGLKSFTDLAPEWVKIDMSMVRNVHRSARRQKTIAALCRLCHESGCVVVGEGVETVDERDALVDLGCDLLQGYLIGRPDAYLPRRGHLT